MKKFKLEKYHYTLLLLVIIVNAIFSYTYPLNIAAYDNSNYLSMILENKSNLIHASGYPAMISIIMTIFEVIPPTNVINIDWLNIIQIINLVLHLLFFTGAFFLCSNIFGKRAAVIMSLIWGLNPIVLTGVNAAAPEWLQGDLIALSFLIAMQNFNRQSAMRKTLLYVISFSILFVAYLVKFNTLVIFPALFLIILLESKNFIWKIKTLIICFLACWALFYLFVKIYHQPTTGTKQLNYDHAWVLMDAIPNDYFNVNIDQLGMSSLRWKALRAVVPTDITMAGAYCCIDSGASSEIRKPYLTSYAEIMNLSRSQLLEFIKTHPLSPNVSNFAMSVPLYWYVGLAPIDNLGIDVFKESAVQDPIFYIKKIVNGFTKWHLNNINFITIPRSSNALNLIMKERNDTIDNDFQYYTIPDKAIAQHFPYWNPVERLWLPGTKFFNIVFKYMSSRTCELLLLMLASTGLMVTKSRKFTIMGVLSALGVIAFSAASFVLLGLRNKEAISIIPLYSIFMGIGLTSIITRIWLMVHKKNPSEMHNGKN